MVGSNKGFTKNSLVNFVIYNRDFNAKLWTFE